ncbi:MAG TPA: cytochrome c [Tepidisphaeraceae bacterium]|nr:cytochrome c [Tepidisphaeraceae bacterium]
MQFCSVLISILVLWPLAAHADEAQVARGRYLSTAGDCVVCHTRPQPGAPAFAGGYPLHAAPGTVYSSNITPDRETGIGKWTPDQFFRAMHDGISADGRHLYPAFPYVYFSRLSRADDDAIFAYLKTLKPVRYRPPRNTLIFPTNIRAGMIGWNALFLHLRPFQSDHSRSAAWNRGKELVTGVAHCGGCHTGKNFMFGDVSGPSLRGGLADAWYAPNLNGDTPDGLGSWSVADIAQYLKEGSNRFTRAAGAMRDVVDQSTSQLTEADRNAIATYLKSLPPVSRKSVAAPSVQQMQKGQAVYTAQCAACHEVNGRGSTAYPSLAGNTLLAADNPDTVLRIVQQGTSAPQAVPDANRFSMPAFGTLSDADLADVATYIRNAWGNHAAAISAKDAKSFRQLLRAGD